MMNSSFVVGIASLPDREKLVAEIFLDGEQWGELNEEGSELTLEIYARRDGRPWQLRYEDVTAALAEARARLLGE